MVFTRRLEWDSNLRPLNGRHQTLPPAMPHILRCSFQVHRCFIRNSEYILKNIFSSNIPPLFHGFPFEQVTASVVCRIFFITVIATRSLTDCSMWTAFFGFRASKVASQTEPS